ncbi:unnamed protein product [Rhizophagus irregularis]|uniref:Uncharacterized protein n=1 Tax=Rhizophagus irregularis TaxID=588596 RepID=A0A915YRC6_9GLOM|nr:unnamed protein product [Rhizophagus irregularis]CAB5320752.1 unnamed protein product [Rhizophagus irregularis]
MEISSELRINHMIICEIAENLQVYNKEEKEQMELRISSKSIHTKLGLINIAIRIKCIIRGEEPYENIKVYKENELPNRKLRENEITIRNKEGNLKKINDVIEFMVKILQKEQEK